MKEKRNFFLGFVLGILLAGVVSILFLRPYFNNVAVNQELLLQQEALKLESQQESSYAPLLKNAID